MKYVLILGLLVGCSPKIELSCIKLEEHTRVCKRKIGSNYSCFRSSKYNNKEFILDCKIYDFLRLVEKFEDIHGK